MQLHVNNGATLDYHDWQVKWQPEQPYRKASVTSILFDESHEELLQLRKSSNDDSAETWNALEVLLQEIPELVVTYHSSSDGPISSEILKGHDVLVLAAPTTPFADSEVEAIIEFVLTGKSLLVASNYDAFRKQVDNYDDSLNLLLEAFGLRFREVLSFPSEEVSHFYPHYLSSEVNQVFLKDPVYIEVIEDKADKNKISHVVATLSSPQEPCLVAAETEDGRVVAISDVILLKDEFLEYGDNDRLIFNIFCWLAAQNQLDCFGAQVPDKVLYSKQESFTITLSNPHQKRLEYISCLLEAEAGTEILEHPEKTIRSLAPGAQTRVEWSFRSTRLGLQKLKLTIDSLREPETRPLFFDAVAQFNCIPADPIDLVILNDNEIPEVIETNQPVWVTAVLRQQTAISQTGTQLALASSSNQVDIEPVEQPGLSNCWRLVAKKSGDYPITLVVNETGQRISRLIRVQPSVQEKISEIEKNIISPISEEIHRLVIDLGCGLDAAEIQQIPFRLYTPEQYLEKFYSNQPRVLEQLLEALQVAKDEKSENRALVKLLLRYIFPTYEPGLGCCIPYDPELATHLVRKHPFYEENLSQNFLTVEDGQTYLRQNIAALILHEKYGHGFFFTQTTLGKQLACLYRHQMDGINDASVLKAPYPRSLYKQYQKVIQVLWNGSKTVIEGFATWLELAIIPRLSEPIAFAAFRRKSFLFSDLDNQYKSGYECFRSIEEFYGEDGFAAAVEALREAADIDVGIIEENNRIRFILDAATLMEELESSSADIRLQKIRDAL